MPPRNSSRRTAALFLLSAGALCFEVALLRLYAIQQFYHFAFLVVSLAVLGTAAGGTALALRRRPASLPALAGGFSASVVLAYATLQFLPFDSYAVAWDRRQIVVLGLYFGSAALPFFFHGWFTGALLAVAGASPGRVYASNLLGAAAGPPLALLTTATLRLESAVAVSAATGLVASGVLAQGVSRRVACLAVAGALGLLALRPPQTIHLRLSPNKPLAQARLYPDAVQTEFRDGYAARLEVVASRGIHSFPGLSLNHRGPLPDQVAVYLDGDGPLAATNLDPEAAAARALAQSMPAGLAYELRRASDALVLDPGAGLSIALALAAGARSVDAPIDDPLIFEMLRGPYAEYTFGIAADRRVRWLPSSSRGALVGGGAYDVIEIALTDPFRPAASGAYSLTEDYLLTIEAMTSALQDLAPDGILVMTRWLTTPPAESLRAWSTLVAALERRGEEDPARRLAAYRSLRTSTVLAAGRPWTAGELATIRAFLHRNGYDPIFLPDLAAAEVNRYNRIPEDPYPPLFQALLDDRAALERSYPYRIQRATDDRPYFFHFFRWSQTPEVLATLGRTWQPFGGSGYLVLLALLVLMLLLAGGLVLASFFARPAGRLSIGGGVYFACLGVGFLFVELALLSSFTLPLERATFAFAVVVSTILLASGVGSRFSDRLQGSAAPLVLGSAAAATAVLLPSLVSGVLEWPFALRLLACLFVLAPLGFLMGMPFPLGLRRFAGRGSEAVGWAWSINGAVSGVAGVAAAMISVDLGFRTLLALGGMAYLAAWIILRRSHLRQAAT